MGVAADVPGEDCRLRRTEARAVQLVDLLINALADFVIHTFLLLLLRVFNIKTIINNLICINDRPKEKAGNIVMVKL